ncbi:MAG: asparagine synthase (glutamine-hydrolyzing) [Acidobacteria bacterium]|nr:MAG: asparagine synthase (glutamine-hydrolyzing) [Acidobacteriota bacterium]
MCGIVGMLANSSPPWLSRQVLENMTSAIRHRGPDDSGIYFSAPVALGHRRLSIIDVAGGHQPMSNGDESIWLVFNGEIYNHGKLRCSLADAGHEYKSSCDTETILHLYAEYGLDFVKHLEGMFALALWDSARKRLILARDRIGIKPLYYSHQGADLLFASEIKALKTVPGLKLEVDPQALDSFLALQYIPGPGTIYKEVKKLPPGHMLIIENGRTRLEAYWELNPTTPPASFEEGCHLLRKALEQAISDRLMSDVPLGAFLSGGVDSSLIVAMMVKQSRLPVQTFTIGFEGGGWHSETPFAQEMATYLGTDHHVQMVEALDLQSLLQEVVHQFDEPLADVAAIPTLLLSRYARRSITVCLTGEGADELFAGYRRYRAERLMAHFPVWGGAVARGMGRLLAPVSGGRGDRFMAGLGLPAPDRFLHLRTVIPPGLRRRLLLPAVREHLPEDYLSNRFATHFQARSGLNAHLTADLKEWLPDDLLMKVDKMSMLTSLEARVPFLDHRVVEIATGFPANWKLHKGNDKLLLRRVAREYLPASIMNRPKHGFMPPVSKWLAGELRPFVESTLMTPEAASWTFLDQHETQAVVNRYMAGDKRLFLAVWLLLNLEIWFRQNL